MTVAPSTLVDLQDRCVTKLGMINDGIVGDTSHQLTGGYHIGATTLRNVGMGGDYSLSFGLDANDHTDHACAVDIGGTPAKLEQLGNRLVHALKAYDPRVYGKVRGTNAPFDGWQIDRRYDCENPNTKSDDNTQSSDDRGHIHIEIYRTLVTVQSVVDGLFDVLAGVTSSQSGPYLHRMWPSWMPANHYFGLVTGPATSHGGYFVGEQPAIAAIQRRLVANGAHIADKFGLFGMSTKHAVGDWQRKHMPGTELFGEVWPDDWNKLFTY